MSIIKTNSKALYNDQISKDQGGDSTNLISWCVNDLANELYKNNFQLSDEDKKDITMDLILSTIKHLVIQKEDERLGDVQGLSSCIKLQQTTDDFQAVIALYWGIYPYFGIAFSKAFAVNYIQKCLDFRIQPNQSYINFILNY